MTQRGPLRLAPEATATDLRRRGIAAREDSIADPGAFDKGAVRSERALEDKMGRSQSDISPKTLSLCHFAEFSRVCGP